MMDDLSLAAIYAAWLALSTMPLGFMLGSSCSPCCGSVGCGVADGKPRTDPATEGVWTPSGTWFGGGVTWTYSATPSTTDGGTWFFYGSASTSKVGGGASTAEQEDWGNICNWYSNKTTSPNSTTSLALVLDKRATRLPPADAIVHVYSPIDTASISSPTVKNIYVWRERTKSTFEVTTTDPAHDSVYGAVWLAAVFSPNLGRHNGTLNGGAYFVTGQNEGIINGGAHFRSITAINAAGGTVNGGADFYSDASNAGVVNGGASFFGNSGTTGNTGVVNDGATFYDSTLNGSTQSSDGTVNDGATFYDNSINTGSVNGGATFYDSAESLDLAWTLISGGSTFYDSSCTRIRVGTWSAFPTPPCTRQFLVQDSNGTYLPTCNGTAVAGCDAGAEFALCGCG
jgi:hypothetical protein